MIFDEGLRLDVLVEDLTICELKAIEQVNLVKENFIMMKRILLIVFSLCMSAFYAESQTIMEPDAADTQPFGIVLHYVDPLQKVFPETNTFPSLKAVANVARGGYATLQYVIRTPVQLDHCSPTVEQVNVGFGLISSMNAKIGFVDYVRTGKTIPDPPADKLVSPSGFFPDPIIDTPSINLRGNYTQPIWVSIKIPNDCPPGLYNGKLVIRGFINKKKVELETSFTIHVYPVTVGTSNIWVTNWFNFSENALEQMNDGRFVVPYTKRYWQLLQVIAEKMASFGQNVVMISPLQLAKYSFSKGHYSMDFENFDKYVNTFMNAGALKRIEGGHIGAGIEGYGTAFEVYVPIVSKDTTIFKLFPISSDRAQNFYKQFIPELISHLKEKGWLSMYMQHIADEPTDQNYQSYISIAAFFKKLAPNVPIIDAIQTKKLNNIVNVWVPLLSVLDKDYDYFLGRQYKGDELWTYICTVPQGNYANRFIELPLIKPRLIFWIMFRYDLQGYLHWGFNFWNDHPFYETVQPNEPWPGGDSYMVYPGYGKLYSSIRFEAQRDGIIDNTLLSMLARRQPDKAKELCDQVIHSFSSYNTDILAFRQIHKELLELLSK